MTIHVEAMFDDEDGNRVEVEVRGGSQVFWQRHGGDDLAGGAVWDWLTDEEKETYSLLSKQLEEAAKQLQGFMQSKDALYVENWKEYRGQNDAESDS